MLAWRNSTLFISQRLSPSVIGRIDKPKYPRGYKVSTIIKLGVLLFLVAIPDYSLCEGKNIGNPNQNGNRDNESSHFKELFRKLLNNEDSFQNILTKEMNEGSLAPMKKLVDDGVPVQVILT